VLASSELDEVLPHNTTLQKGIKGRMSSFSSG